MFFQIGSFLFGSAVGKFHSILSWILKAVQAKRERKIKQTNDRDTDLCSLGFWRISMNSEKVVKLHDLQSRWRTILSETTVFSRLMINSTKYCPDLQPHQSYYSTIISPLPLWYFSKASLFGISAGGKVFLFWTLCNVCLKFCEQSRQYKQWKVFWVWNSK